MNDESSNVFKIYILKSKREKGQVLIFDDQSKSSTDIPHILKVRQFTFRIDRCQDLFLLTERNTQGIFASTNKGENSTVFSICFCRTGPEAACNRGHHEWPHQAPSQGITLRISASAATALKCVREHQCLISIYFVHQLARCILRYQKSLRDRTGITLSVKLDTIKHISYDSVGVQGTMGMIRVFSDTADP